MFCLVPAVETAGFTTVPHSRQGFYTRINLLKPNVSRYGMLRFLVDTEIAKTFESPTPQTFQFEIIALQQLYQWVWQYNETTQQYVQVRQITGIKEWTVPASLTVYFQWVKENLPGQNFVLTSAMPDGAVVLSDQWSYNLEFSYSLQMPSTASQIWGTKYNGEGVFKKYPLEASPEYDPYKIFTLFEHQTNSIPANGIVKIEQTHWLEYPIDVALLKRNIGPAPCQITDYQVDANITVKTVPKISIQPSVPDSLDVGFENDTFWNTPQQPLQTITVYESIIPFTNKFVPDCEMKVYDPKTQTVWLGDMWFEIEKRHTIFPEKADFPVKMQTTAFWADVGTNFRSTPFKKNIDATDDWQEWINYSDSSPDNLGQYGWKEKNFAMRAPYLGWSMLELRYDYPVPNPAVFLGSHHGIWWREALTGEWKVTFTDGWGEETFALEESYSGDFDTDTPPVWREDEWGYPRPFYDGKKYNIVATGSRGTVFAGVATLYPTGTIEGGLAPAGLTVTIMGSFANPHPDWKGLVKTVEYGWGGLVTIRTDGKLKIAGYFSDGVEFTAIRETTAGAKIKWVTDNDGNLVTMEVPRATSNLNKAATASVTSLAAATGAAALAEGTSCGLCGTCSFREPMTNQWISFNYSCDPNAADPIHINNLEYVEAATDLTVKGRGINFEFTRTYKSRINFDGPLGHNWDHNYNMRFVQHPEQANVVILYDGAGRGDAYYKGSDGKFTSPTGYANKLVQESDGSLLLRQPNGSVCKFYALGDQPKDGQLAAIITRCGDRLTFEYNDKGQLATVRDAYNRSTIFAYNSNGRITSITAHTGQQVNYAYDNNGDLVSVKSPAVTGTPNGNDFPNGKELRYTYSSGSQDAKLNHNLLTVVAPKESPDGPAYVTNYYDSDDRLIRQDWGGTNNSGIAAGGTIVYARQILNNGVEPSNIELPREVVTVIDRNGNETVFTYNCNKQLLKKEEKTRGVRPGDPASYITQYKYTSAGYLSEMIMPQGNRVVYEYDEANADPFQTSNLLSLTKYPDARGGDQQFHKVSYQYEPVFNQVWKVTDTRGNDPAYVPQNGGSNTPTRYTMEYVPDYFEGDMDTPGCTCGHTLRQLADKWGIDLMRVQSQLNQGDLNGDGQYAICGNLIMTRYPKATLRTGSPQASAESGNIQIVETRVIYNKFGQVDKIETPEGEITEYFYYGETDPEGDGQNLLSGNNNNGRELDANVGGYLKEVIRDYAHTVRYRGTAAPARLNTKFAYDNKGNIISTTDARGVRTDFVVNALNQIVEVTRAADVSQATETGLTAYAYKSRIYYDANNNVVKTEAEYRDGNNQNIPQFVTSTTVYDILNKPVETSRQISSGEVAITRYRYDANQNLIEVQSPLAVAGTQPGNKVQMRYDERDFLYQTIVAPGTPEEAIATIKYDLNGNKIEVRDAQDNNGDGQGEATTFTYDGFDRLIRATDAAGNEVTSQYDPAGNVIEAQLWGTTGGVTRSTNSTTGNVMLAQGFAYYDELSRVYQRDAALFMPQGVTTTRPVTLVDNDAFPGDGRITSFTDYDRNSRVTFATAPSPANAAKVSQLFYDGLSRMIRALDPVNNEVVSEYDKNSNIVKTTRIDRHTTNRVVSESFVTLNVFDSLNRLVRTTDAVGQTRRVYYDSFGQVIRASDAQGTLIPDPLGKYTQGQINSDGNISEAVHDALGRILTSVRELRQNGQGGQPLDTSNPVNPDGKIIENSVWDLNSRLVSVSDDKGNTTSYTYDNCNRLTQITFADGTTHQLAYDKDNNMVQFTDNNGTVVNNTFDGLHRLVRKEINRSTTNNVQGTTVQTFEYNGLSRLTRATDNNNPDTVEDDSVVTRSYDSLSRLVEETQNGKVISTNWNESGLTDLTYPNNRKLAYTQDQLDRLKTITSVGNSSPVATYDYLGSRLIERLFGNNTRLTMLNDAGNADAGYDALGRLVQLRHLGAGNTQIAGFSFGYNRENMKLYQESLESPTQSELYKYDSTYRVVDFGRGTLNATKDAITGIASQTQTWQLDGVGNWAATAVNGATQTQAVSSMNEYTAFAGIAQTHSKNGNLTDDGDKLYTWDFANRLTEVRKKADNSLIASYTYDAANRRLSKTTFATEEQPGGDGEYTSDSDTLALYHFNELTGPVVDSSSFHNNGEAPRKIARGVEGLWDTKAVDTNGQAIKVRRPQGFDNLEDKFTVETWVYLPIKECKDQKHKKYWQSCKDRHGNPIVRCTKCCQNLKGGTLVRRPGSFRLRVMDTNNKAVFRLYTQEQRNAKDMCEDDDEADEDDDDADCARRCRPQYRTRTVRILSNNAIPRGEWVHIAAVYDGNKVAIFVNKTKQGDVKSIAGRVRRVSGPLFLGGERLDASLEEARISSIARTSFGGTGNTTITYQIVRNFYYSGWRILEERERKAVVGQALPAERVARQFVDGGGIDEHLTQDVYGTDGTSIEKTLYYHQNHRGDTVALTDAQGNVVARYAYSVYGEVYEINAQGALATPQDLALGVYYFQGREFDEETGLYAFRNRMFDPRQGRFISRDMLGYVDGLGLHEAFGGNPGNYGDPWGLAEVNDNPYADQNQDLEEIGPELSQFVQNKIRNFNYNFQIGDTTEVVVAKAAEQFVSIFSKVNQYLDKKTLAYIDYGPSDTQKYSFAFWGGGADWVAPTVRVNDIIIGTDKIDHFFSEGYKAFKASNSSSEINAVPTVDKSGIALAWSKESERTYYGLLPSGVYSKGDIAANMRGYYFYQQIYSDVCPMLKKSSDSIKNQKDLQKINNYFRAFNFDFSPLVTWQWNEFLNPSLVIPEVREALDKAGQNSIYKDKNWYSKEQVYAPAKE